MEGLRPTPAQLAETRGTAMYRLAIAMSILPTASIALRFWSRWIASKDGKLWWDDWLALISWCLCMCCVGLTFEGIKLGLGHHFYAFKSLADVTLLLRLFYVAEILFDCGIVFAKFSALAFYRRVFTATTKRYKIMYWTTVALSSVFILYKLPAQIWSCVPPRKVWLPDTPGHCQNDYTNFDMLLIGLLLDVITDLMILLLPIPIISGLQIKPNRKLTLFIAFFCGYANWITSIGRMAAFISIRPHLGDPDISWYEMPQLGWSLGEIGTAVLSICVPSWFYLFRRVSKGGIVSLFSSRDVSEFERTRLADNSETKTRSTSAWATACSRFKHRPDVSTRSDPASLRLETSHWQDSETRAMASTNHIVKEQSFDVTYPSSNTLDEVENGGPNHVALWTTR